VAAQQRRELLHTLSILKVGRLTASHYNNVTGRVELHLVPPEKLARIPLDTVANNRISDALGYSHTQT
jgi:hypothetical protein